MKLFTSRSSIASLIILLAASVVVNASDAVVVESEHQPQQRSEQQEDIHPSQLHRQLGGFDVPYKPGVDECKIGTNSDGTNIYGECDPNKHFPNCDPDKGFYCFNRINRRDKFYADKQPYYFIDPRRVWCYPMDWLKWGGCSTCSPGRYCASENRCILDERVYECERWW
mmetsp:Transcript_16719/g.23587  ORF Transcript_16719/g.23587 Transcript_16719/m.23587 type:complete len:169 (+) Transcript_16719:303-809(+)